jgi:hypothetical protein
MNKRELPRELTEEVLLLSDLETVANTMIAVKNFGTKYPNVNKQIEEIKKYLKTNDYELGSLMRGMSCQHGDIDSDWKKVSLLTRLLPKIRYKYSIQRSFKYITSEKPPSVSKSPSASKSPSPSTVSNSSPPKQIQQTHPRPSAPIKRSKRTLLGLKKKTQSR